MIFKEKRSEKEYEYAPILLKIIAEDFDSESKKMGIQSVVTRIKEVVSGESGVHQKYRAIDFRNEHAGNHLYTKDQAAYLVNFINEKYPRLDGFKTIIHHSFNGGPDHFHVQIPELVVMMRKKEVL